MRANKTFKTAAEAWALYHTAVDGIGPVEHYRAQAERVSGLQTIQHRGLKSVIARADVLQINHQRVQTGKLFWRWTQVMDSVSIKTDRARSVPRGHLGGTHRFQ